MEFNVDVRRVQLDSLDQFIKSSKKKIEDILVALNWEAKTVLEDKKLITCTLDSGHKVPQLSADQHLKKCALKKEGYDLNEQFLSEPTGSAQSSILIDVPKKIEIFTAAHQKSNSTNFKIGWNGQEPDPKTSNRLLSTFSRDERLSLYDYAVQMTKGPESVAEYNISQQSAHDDSKPLSHEEQLALERDAKRRRIKYRSVHTSRKSHTEVMREVINNQMEEYKEWLGVTDNGAKKEIDKRSTSRNSCTSSGSYNRREIKREYNDLDSTRKCSRDRESRDNGKKHEYVRKRSRESRDVHRHDSEPRKSAHHREKDDDREYRRRSRRSREKDERRSRERSRKNGNRDNNKS